MIQPIGEIGSAREVLGLIGESGAQASGIGLLKGHHIEAAEPRRDVVQVAAADHVVDPEGAHKALGILVEEADDLLPVILAAGLAMDLWRGAVQAYLASVAFVDHSVGRVLDALDASPYGSNTIVVLFSDHGWHLGEKERWAKRSLWNDGTRVPLIVVAPGHEGNLVSDRPVGLIDIFPTLLELAELLDPAGAVAGLIQPA